VRGPSRPAGSVLARRKFLSFAVALFLGCAAVVGHPLSSTATPGVDDYPPRLKRAGQDVLVDPWLFYNRECTSFVAWRLNNDGGVEFSNYYLGKHWGDASNWRHAALQAGVTVNDRPAVGAIAWWRAGSPGSSRGHVAWVENVSSSAITIEEYNYAVTGGYGTRTIDTSSSVWPSAFIHVGDLAMHNVVAPSITGDVRVGQRLTAAKGGWRPLGADFTYQWLANGVPVAGATRKIFTPRAPLLGQRIQVRITATKPGIKTRTAVSPQTPAVRPGLFTPVAAPTISGTAQVDQTLTATHGDWTPRGTYSFRWFAGGDLIPGADGPTLTPTAGQLNRPITVSVAVSRPGYRVARAASEPTAAVIPGTFRNPVAPGIEGTAQVGAPLSASPGSWTPTGAERYQWLVDGEPQAGATDDTFTPDARDLGSQVTVQVTVRRAGYTAGVATAAPTNPVVRGDFATIGQPMVVGHAQVDVPLTADPGSWSPSPKLTYQWFDEDQAIAGATERTYTPTPDQAGDAISVQVTAHRPGYNSFTSTSAPTDAVALGEIKSLSAPTVRGRAMVGQLLAAGVGSWSVTPASIAYRWRVDGRQVADATAATYALSRADGAHKVSVRVIVRAPGYAPATETSAAVRVLLGQASFLDRPTIHGRARVGRTLTARAGPHTPRAATVSYRWYRDGERIRRAADQTYTVRRADLGHHLRVRVVLTAHDWASAAAYSVRTPLVR
jgi:surface antigen